jgi:hypothetical protein
VPRLAAHVDAQAELAARLRRAAESSYRTAAAEFDTATRGARLLGAEVAARWQDYAASGDLAAELRGKRPARKGGRKGSGPAATRAARYDAALTGALAGLAVAIADRAAERVARAWQADPVGAGLLTAAAKSQEQSRHTEQIFASAFGPPSTRERPEEDGDSFIRSGEKMISGAKAAVEDWRDQLTRRLEGVSGARSAQALGLLAITALLADGTERDDDIVTEPWRLLTSALGADEAAALLAAARTDLGERAGPLLEAERLRFTAILDTAGPVDPVAAIRLHEAGYTLEAAR